LYLEMQKIVDTSSSIIYLATYSKYTPDFDSKIRSMMIQLSLFIDDGLPEAIEFKNSMKSFSADVHLKDWVIEFTNASSHLISAYKYKSWGIK